jgi:hypothetical protein
MINNAKWANGKGGHHEGRDGNVSRNGNSKTESKENAKIIDFPYKKARRSKNVK